MTRPVAVLRPEPGNHATALRIEATGLRAIRLPLFAVRPLAWTPPDPRRFDALILTSANAARLAGAGLDALRSLPVHAVGAATAAAAQAQGLSVATVGQGDGQDLLETVAAEGVERALLLVGRDRRLDAGGIVAQAITVYASNEQAIAPPAIRNLSETVALLHSARAAQRLGELADRNGVDRGSIRLGAISRAVADAAGHGWNHVGAAPSPDDEALVALAQRLAD
ncbi:uroporphyrinogen-III synthase [Sphingomonas sp.]|jgi:uroporphyrinogen-III synthase|uniref:uroporphyrinogen-III synthase n=1 Tax=Sphingomonas sp. TaxID=28214 RepID=UPI002E33D800|nr:uroporphyrinogen-III synthase [Sphingomonas sp.]HEX4695294.1 uroporphyrinogen-III synthase [Sphingomonas sp.]